MFAINHAATALILKKGFINVPIVWLLISVQFMEILWVILNFLGIERTTTEKEVRYVGDVHLSFMPFSHSILTMIGVALLAWLVLSKGLGLPGAGIAVGIGVLSHLILDLITHSDDMVIAPLMKSPKFGLGLYAKHPIVAFILEIGYGIVCWWIYKGSWALLSVIILFNLANVSMFFSAVTGIEKHMANRPRLITTVILAQILVTLTLVGIFS
ncbi:MAG TPA: metal-dependent hydrolase [Thermodesulfobacteriota bacterium]|nr:metal-dependent hydrolase [Thermodesulfobacteriota bacterium]